jgi:hypothetical protein
MQNAIHTDRQRPDVQLVRRDTGSIALFLDFDGTLAESLPAVWRK